MEAASKKRGRPPAFAPHYFDFMKDVLPGHTRRNKLNRLYSTDGLQIIRAANQHEFFLPLFDDRPEASHRRGAVKTGVLAEIGRYARAFGDQFALERATRIVHVITQHNLTAREAELCVRRWRLVESPPD